MTKKLHFFASKLSKSLESWLGVYASATKVEGTV